MEPQILSYLDMCTIEGVSLQQGMNFRLGGRYSVILMSVRANAPYRDALIDDGTTLVYEGHDSPRVNLRIDPKAVDQPEFTAAGSPTQNGKFHRAAQDAKAARRPAELVRVYEKIRPGIWADNGFFNLVDSWQEHDGKRKVFKFKLAAIEGASDQPSTHSVQDRPEPRRLIPTQVKLAVWQRDGGKCVRCGATDELHFDHIIPYSRGGTSLSPENVQLLCARHNIEKRDKIE